MTSEQKVGLFFLGGILLFAGFIEATVGTGLVSRSYPLFAEYKDVQGLGPGSQVWVGGVDSGKVQAVQVFGDRVRVELAMDEATVVRSDAVARLDFQALSGQRFVAIDLGTPEAAPHAEGATLRSEEPTGISQMIDELNRVAVEVGALATSLNENQDRFLERVDGMLEENRLAIAQTMANVQTITERLERGEGTMGKMLTDPALFDRAVATLESLDATFASVRVVTERLARGEGTVGRLLTDDAMYDEVRETLASVGTTARNLEEISEQVRSGEGTLGRLLVDDELYVEAEQALTGVSRATQSIEDQAPVSILGTLLGVVF